jgi:tRNA dimethylallyltransferase
MPPIPVLHVLTGCTGTGKTEWALQWARAHGAEIVSCDSLCVYRGMDIGTAKPTAAERARVPHHLIDVAAPHEPYDVVRYVDAARAAVDDITARGKPVLVTGGSGFYLKAFFAPVADAVPADPALRARLEAQLEAEGLEPLLAELRSLNPDGLGSLDVHNPRRVLRALERCRITGRPLAELTAAFHAQPGPFADYSVRLVRIERDPAELEARLAARITAMISAGLIEEVRRLDAAGLRRNPSAARAIGYRETLALLDGRLEAAAWPGTILHNTRALVRKQRTWLRNQLPAHPILQVHSGEPVDPARLWE